jgi:hypothetical protein
MHALKKRLTYLRDREALAAFLLPAVIVYKWQDAGGQVSWGIRLGALFLLSYILLQGTWYWHLKLRVVGNGKPLPAYFHRLFYAFWWSNLAGMGALLAALLGAGALSLSSSDIKWCAGLLAGALLEHINYYHYQLMYDTRAAFDFLRRNRRLRKAALGLDMARVRQAAPG